MASARLTKVAVVNFMIENSDVERDGKRVDGKDECPSLSVEPIFIGQPEIVSCGREKKLSIGMVTISFPEPMFVWRRARSRGMAACCRMW